MSKTEHIRLLLVRVGPTEWGDAGRLVGSTDLPLSAAGQADLLTHVESLGALELGPVLHAKDEASTQTAKALAQAGKGKHRSVEGLGEVKLGLWEGMRAEELEDKCPTAFKHWRADPGGVAPPEGETASDAQARLIDALCKAVERAKPNGRPLTVVLHPLAWALVKLWLDEAPTSDLWRTLKDAPAFEWRMVPRAALKRRRAGAAA